MAAALHLAHWWRYTRPPLPRMASPGFRQTGRTSRRLARTWVVPPGFPHSDGAFVKYATLPSRMLRPLPGGLGLRDAALVEPASVAWHAVARAGDVHGKSALVIGSGPIGALAVAVLKRAGATEIIAVDMHPFPLDIARAVG